MVNTNLNICGKFLLIFSGIMAIPLAISLAFRQPDSMAFVTSILITALAGICLSMFFKAGNSGLRIRDGFVLVGLLWVAAGIFGALPFYFSKSVPSFVDAVFETVSGFTTTGATVFASVEDKPMGMLFWRSLSHWLGGMGIIVLSVAFLPRLGAGAMQLFRAEVPGPTAERLIPRIKETAKVLWIIYAALTITAIFALLLAGMNLFEAVNHAFSTMGTGGFSTRNLSVASFASPLTDWVIIFLMLAAGINFTLYYYLFNGRWSLFYKDRELRYYLATVAVAGAVITANLFFTGTYASLRESIRHSYFQVSSLITTTGYSSADFNLWPPLSRGILMLMEFIGGSAGSTAGGIKVIRVLIVLKFIRREFYRLLHPKIVRPVRVGNKVIPEEMLSNIAAFVFLYILIFVVAGLLVSAMGVDILSAFTGAAATLGNTGPGLNKLGPLSNFGFLPAGAKLVYILCMLLGRLEIFTFILFLVSPFTSLAQILKAK
ncbi:MAG TPA: TrkH family potassium uptake protein [Bacillota bacterium]|nr:TrkH family potassium uptake protein [Bacillota bacterium]HPZ21659.1 TrkH family potassium uptake protein [Bacillota bacterium]HQD19497.1 TrkH family potassium uptake protein [Bacillota bacterium]